MPRHHRRELAAEQLAELGTGLVNGFLRGFVPAAGDGFTSCIQAFGFSFGDDAVDTAGLHQATERRYFVKLVALGGELRRAGFDYFGDFAGCLVIDSFTPLLLNPSLTLPLRKGEDVRAKCAITLVCLSISLLRKEGLREN